jgi:hypothetical protein
LRVAGLRLVVVPDLDLGLEEAEQLLVSLDTTLAMSPFFFPFCSAFFLYADTALVSRFLVASDPVLQCALRALSARWYAVGLRFPSAMIYCCFLDCERLYK